MASAMPNQVKEGVKRARAKILRQLSQEKRQRFHGSFVGKTLGCLTQGRDRKSGFYKGISDNYIPLFFKKPVPANTIIQARVTSLSKGLILAEPV